MNRPRTNMLVMGHPFVGAPMLLADAFVGYVYTDSAGFGFGTLIALIFAGWVTNCMKLAAQYRAWKREWNALDPNYQAPQPVKNTLRYVRALFIAGPILAGIFWLAAHYSDPTSAAHWLAPLVAIALPILWLVSVFARRQKRQAKAREWTVAQAATRPQPAPTVAEAFASLPEYCRPLFSPSEPQRKDHA